MTTWDRARVLITGGTRGIGYAVATLVAGAGGEVTVVGTDQERANQVAKALGRAHGIGWVIDGCEAGAKDLVDRAARLMGGLTGVVNAAGGATVGHALEVPWQIWQQDWNVKFWGYFALIRAAIPYLKPTGGTVVNILGVTGKDPNPKLAPATAINGALRGLTKILADDLAEHGIRVVAVNPGATETGLLVRMAQGYATIDALSVDEALKRLRSSGPLGQLPSAYDVAQAVKFLLSEEARLITGTSLDIDGGAHRGPA